MLLKIFVVGALLIGVMAVVKNGRILRDAGLLSTCSAVTVNGQGDPTLLSCTKGRLDGWPDETNNSCNLIAVHPTREYWRCAAPVISSRTPTG
ncbi:MAG TPA: hypothetical protein VGH26_01045 [Gaiellaceae bacterium]|jgi:hypothetical protein